MSYRKLFADAKTLNFADTADLSHTLSVKSGVSKKTVKGVSTLNNRLEFVEAVTAPVTEGTATADESISLRVSLSGSVQNSALIAARWAVLKANVDAAIADAALEGFLPINAVFVTTVS